MERPAPRPLSPMRRTLLALLGLFLAAATPFVAASLPAENILFQPAPLLAAIERSPLYSDTPRLVIAFVAAGGDLLTPGLGGWVAQNLVQTGAAGAIRFIFPETWLRDQTGRLVTAVYAYANFNQPTLDPSFDLRPVKARLSGGEGRQLIENTLLTWPDCTLEDGLLAGGLLLQGRAAELPRCKPPAELTPAYLEMLQLGMDAVAAGLPDRFQLLPARGGPPGPLYTAFRWVLRLSPFLLLLFPIAASAFLGCSARPLLAWAGPPLYTGGLIAVLTSGIAFALCVWLLPFPLSILTPPQGELYTFAAALFFAVWRQFLTAWAIAGAILAVMGLLFILTANRIPIPTPAQDL